MQCGKGRSEDDIDQKEVTAEKKREMSGYSSDSGASSYSDDQEHESDYKKGVKRGVAVFVDYLVTACRGEN